MLLLSGTTHIDCVSAATVSQKPELGHQGLPKSHVGPSDPHYLLPRLVTLTTTVPFLNLKNYTCDNVYDVRIIIYQQRKEQKMKSTIL